jgi:hypothetical protein
MAFMQIPEQNDCYSELLFSFVPFIAELETLRLVYFAYVHSIMSYGIIFGGNLPYSETIFKMQKKVIRIMENLRVRDSCRECLKKWKYCRYIPNIFFL